ncbi:MAG TPA: preprotein translocase subunit SecA [Actinomycetota bacterium]|jgi:preprotein translocase subunit SecA|nr:preprotein translocase subunit SecA [Actinomycetota bacterium]
MSILKKVLSAGEGKKVKALQAIVPQVNALEDEIAALDDASLSAKTAEFRTRIDNGEHVDRLLPEGFAVVREAARRVIGQRHFDVQLMGGAALHNGWIAEMKTGEGKTLTSTLAVYLNALWGEGVHVVTVNDYLAKRDSEWMGQVYRFLGLSVGLIQAQMSPQERKPAYASDITYGTNNEFGFDYLRDNMVTDYERLVQRGHFMAVVDEVDSILIDEARTPLIISGAVQESTKWYQTFARISPRLQRDVHYEVDEKKRTIAISEEGISKVEELLGVDNLYDHVNTDLVHHLQSALKAKELYKRDVEYVVQSGEVLIVDEFTGRILPGRRYSEGLHQAIEAKEAVRIKEENQTLATITLQNYFRMYEKLAGMTGTASTEAAEFGHIYKLEVAPIPTNRPMVRADEQDLIYKTGDAKWDAVAADIKERYERGQPVLVGTVSVEKSEHLSRVLDKSGVPHKVLNAKHHEHEAEIVAQAGRKHAVTVATNMAGRGVDIILGGNAEGMARAEMKARGWDNDKYLLGGYEQEEAEQYEAEYQPLFEKFKKHTDAEREEVVGLGGLYVLGTERHESRRIDNQLRGRSGRQGDPGESRFYLSLEDDLMRLFASDRIGSIMERLRIPDDVPIEAKMVSKAIERAQLQVESMNFEIRKNVLKYDEVMDKQRQVIYSERRRILEGDDFHDQALELISDVIESAVAANANPEVAPDEWDWEQMFGTIREIYPTRVQRDSFELETVAYEDLLEVFLTDALDVYRSREEELGAEELRRIERLVLLNVIDNRWREHLYEMDYLQEGIGLRAMGQKDPLVEYQREGYGMFLQMQQSIKEDFVRYVFHVEIVRDDERRPARQMREERRQVPLAAAGAAAAGSGAAPGPPETEEPAVVQARSDKIPRNAPCPCGSGKKYKQCHGAPGAGPL